ncbi:MAG: MFS transporter [Sporichthyaceae bacterium]
MTAAPPKMGRVAGAAFAGTAIEFYDFFIFGTATALVFGNAFFGQYGGTRGTLALGATYAVAFIARPIGSVLFGHVGDRLGRKRTLVFTLLLMGLSTFAIGLLPDYDAIGVAAPILLVTLRFLQGLAVGGEWAGAALLAAEHAPPHRRGLYSMFPQLGPPVAFGASALTFLVVFEATGDPTKNTAFQEWGWRVPFLFSIVLVAVGLWIRLKIEETPVFAAALDAAAPVRIPVREAIAAQWRQILLVGGALSGLFAFFYVGTVFLTGYAGRNPTGVPPGILGLSTPTILRVHVLAAGVFVACVVVSALYCDRFGRRAFLLGANAATVVLGLVLFAIVDDHGLAGFATGLCLIVACVGIAYGPLAAFLPEMFDARYRYTAAGLGYNLGGVLGGAIPIVLAHQILEHANSFAIGAYLSVLGLFSTVCVALLRDTKDADIPAAATQTQVIRPTH